MSKLTDDIDESYRQIKNWPGYIEGWLKTFKTFSEGTYSVFREIIQEHPDIGKATIIIMAHNQAGNLLTRVRDSSCSDDDAFNEVVGALAPMYEMFYDRLIHETIENLDSELEDA